MSTTLDLADFILEHYPPYRKWDSEIFLGWLKWHIGHGTVQRALDFDESVVGLTIIRTIMKPQDADNFYAFDPEGNVAFIDVAIATKPNVLQALTLAGLKRFGQRDWVAWKRSPHFVTEFHETSRFLRIILGRNVYGRR
jgi:hypothetical protein